MKQDQGCNEDKCPNRSAQLDNFYRGNALSYGIHWLLRRQIVHLMTMEIP